MAAGRLRAVRPGEKAPRRRKSLPTVTEAAASGDQRALLVALRTRIAKTVEDVNCPPRDLAALSRRLTEITKEIEAIDAREAQVDEDGPTPDEAWEAI